MSLNSFYPTLLAVVFSSFVLFVAHWFLIKSSNREQLASPLVRQLSMVFLALAAALMVVLCLPIGDSTRGQVLSVLGIVLTAAIALSSTTFLGNIMAGLMIKAVTSVRPGDFIKVADHFGRVSELGLLHTEIQNEDRDLTTLPNLYLVTTPVKVVRSSGTIISAEVSLGYDIPYSKVVEALEEAAESCELSEPFVQVMNLGDFSIVYRVAGFLKEVKTLISARSRLRVCVLHHLHEAGIEIVSPHFMNQRRVSADKKVIPPKIKMDLQEDEAVPEELIFDKADQAESIDKLNFRLKELREASSGLEANMSKESDPDKKEAMERELGSMSKRKEYLQKLIDQKKEDNG